ncbi:MAG TPA: ArdC-like ssDNA-binding domain-containing protein [Acidimicrobiales bacterium]|nr:ArdC-like ssDNA-binding domain-containing protein [Acidimicrobiales bacterium]
MKSADRPELLAQLTNGIAMLTTSDEWRRFLDYQSAFHGYSFGNVLLIAAQHHDATQVAGFHAWRKVNRFVRKGESAIFILAPMIYKNADVQCADVAAIRGFKWVPVFDIAQTDGLDPPSVCNRIVGDDSAGRYAQLVVVAQSIGFTVDDVDIPGSTNGDCSFDLRRIRVALTNSPAQRVKTLAHEIAHAMLHEGFKDRPLAELEAESTAYVVCGSLGLDTSGYSFGYVANWAGGGDAAIAGIKASCERIQKTAASILRSFEVDEETTA